MTPSNKVVPFRQPCSALIFKRVEICEMGTGPGPVVSIRWSPAALAFALLNADLLWLPGARHGTSAS
ncbi:hypothetical protein NEUTE2DRAFT_50417 [Neurospora tetrasperma FGSC 2509]|nr:hypothetical protein NEUTE2DRAFT_50417 [Neurospora tetrasperma FGSC 2509]